MAAEHRLALAALCDESDVARKGGRLPPTALPAAGEPSSWPERPKHSPFVVCVFDTGKNMLVKIACSSFEMVLQTIKHTMIYHGSDPSVEVIALHLVV
jgi:hypothetical protein